MPWYRTGTVSVTNNSTTVTGTGTNFSANSRVGDAFQGPDGRWYEVTNIASTTVISILPAYQGTTASGGVYGLAPMQGYVKDSADKLRALTDQMRDITADVEQARVYADSAQTSAASATASSTSASASQSDALASKNSAQTSAATATQKATEASSSASAALASKNAAKVSENNAAASAAQAAASAGDKQPLNSKLTAISNSILLANKILYATGVDTFGVTDFTAYARSLVSAADAAAARTTLQLVKTTTATDTTSGSVLKVGDFGLGGNGITIPVATLNSNTCPSGLYRLDLSVANNSLPIGVYSVLAISLSNLGACHQTATNYTTKALYRRTSVSGQWELDIKTVMVGATPTTAGSVGLVPAPSASTDVRYLSDRGDWRVIDTSTGSGRFFGELVSLPSRNSSPDGVIKADGQLLSNASSLYPDAVADITSGSPTVPVTTAALWLSNPTKRLCWAYDSAANQIRVPDWNGKSAGSLGPAFFRGDGSLGFAPGTLRQDQIQNIKGTISPDTNVGLIKSTGVTTGAFKKSVASKSTWMNTAASASIADLEFDASGSARTGTETFPTHGVGVWGVVLFGSVSNAGAADAAALATSYANQQTQLESIDFVYLYPNGGSQTTPANVAINSRYTLVNPWPGCPVIMQPELLIGGTWQYPGWSYANTGTYGVSCGMFGDTLVVQTGNIGVTGASIQTGGSGGLTSAVTTATPCRVKAWRIKG